MSTNRGVAKGQIFPHHAYMSETPGPDTATAEAAQAAFDRGDFGLARRLARALPAAEGADVRARLTPDPLIALLLCGCALLYTAVVYFTLR